MKSLKFRVAKVTNTTNPKLQSVWVRGSINREELPDNWSGDTSAISDVQLQLLKGINGDAKTSDVFNFVVFLNAFKQNVLKYKIKTNTSLNKLVGRPVTVYVHRTTWHDGYAKPVTAGKEGRVLSLNGKPLYQYSTVNSANDDVANFTVNEERPFWMAEKPSNGNTTEQASI